MSGRQIEVQGAASGSFVCDGTSWSGQLDFTAAPEGNIELKIQGAYTLPLFKDTVPPTAPVFLSVASATSDYTQSPDLFFLEGADAGSGIDKTLVQMLRFFDGAAIVVWEGLATGGRFQGLNLSFNTSYYYQLKAVDKAQNVSESPVDSTTWSLINPPNTAFPNMDKFVWVCGSDLNG